MVTASEEQAPHIFELHQDREAVAVRRWLSLNAAQLVRALTLSDFWWCGLRSLSTRKDVFGDSSEGDIDILAGPLEFNLGEADWRIRIEEESRLWPLHSGRSNVVSLAILRAAAEGLIQWPPTLDTVVACEAKASWFRPDVQQWKRTHVNEAREIKGQLQMLLDQGLDHVGFLHIGATQPRVVGAINPWFQAAADAANGEARLSLIYDPADMPLCGYFSTVLGSVPFDAEHMSGAGGVLRIHQACLPNPTAPSEWRERLRQRLGRLSKPASPTVFILWCPGCGRWNLQNAPLAVACACGLTSAPASTMER